MNVPCASHLLARYHVHSAIHHNDLVERGVAYVLAHIHRIGIAKHLGPSLLHGHFCLGIRGMALEILQLDDVGMLHVGENL